MSCLCCVLRFSGAEIEGVCGIVFEGGVGCLLASMTDEIHQTVDHLIEFLGSRTQIGCKRMSLFGVFFIGSGDRFQLGHSLCHLFQPKTLLLGRCLRFAQTSESTRWLSAALLGRLEWIVGIGRRLAVDFHDFYRVVDLAGFDIT